MTVKKLIGKMHLWLGFSSGLLIFIIAITGCIYAFQVEIQDLTQSFRYVEKKEQAFLPPSVLKSTAEAELPGKHIHAVQYLGADRAAQVIFYSIDPEYYYLVYINPYNGEVLRVKDMASDFFALVLDGHFYLWLPPEVGQPVVATTCLVFIAMLISGLVLWWPRKKKDAKQRFTIKWKSRWRRLNYDLHNVPGFYACAIALILSLTGLVWGFQWFANGLYTVAGGTKELLYSEPPSDTTQIYNGEIPAIDRVYAMMKQQYPYAKTIEVHIPHDDSAPVAANANPDNETYWQLDYRYYDQRTLAEIPVGHIYGRFHDASAADKLLRMNYDIHTGAIIGLPGKIIAFFASLICASLPVTGVYIWWGRRKKEKKSAKKKALSDHSPSKKRVLQPSRA